MEYSFDIDFAKKYGVDEAIMIKSFQYWIRLNKANNSNFYDGHYWTYNTISALSELFPFWSEKQVRLKLNILIKGNYNKLGFDRTIWYAFQNENEFLQITNPKKENANYQTGKSILPNGQMEVTKRANGTAQTGNTIPVTNTITNSITNTNNNIGKTDFSFSEDSLDPISLNDKKQLQKVNSAIFVNDKQSEPAENAKYFFEVTQVLDLLSERTSVRYKIPNTKLAFEKYEPYKLIKERITDGANLEDIFSIIELKFKEWQGTKFFIYMKPSTLFRKSNFDKYLQEFQISLNNNLSNNQNSYNNGIDSKKHYSDFLSEVLDFEL
jgi:uncharacterized phage protein (TIGR02220 family)